MVGTPSVIIFQIGKSKSKLKQALSKLCMAFAVVNFVIHTILPQSSSTKLTIFNEERDA